MNQFLQSNITLVTNDHPTLESRPRSARTQSPFSANAWMSPPSDRTMPFVTDGLSLTKYLMISRSLPHDSFGVAKSTATSCSTNECGKGTLDRCIMVWHDEKVAIREVRSTYVWFRQFRLSTLLSPNFRCRIIPIHSSFQYRPFWRWSRRVLFLERVQHKHTLVIHPLPEHLHSIRLRLRQRGLERCQKRVSPALSICLWATRDGESDRSSGRCGRSGEFLSTQHGCGEGGRLWCAIRHHEDVRFALLTCRLSRN